MTTKLTSIVTIAFLLSLSSCALLPGQSEFTFPLVPRQDSCAGYYEGECDCSNPYVTVCDVASGEWLPSLPSEPSPPPPETSSPPQDVPSNPGCSKKNAKDVSKEFVLENFEIIDRKALLYRIREGLCNNSSCPLPRDINSKAALITAATSECEIAIAVDNGGEVFGYRGTSPDGVQWQQCWDETESIIEKCIKNDLNTGWLNGPNEYQFYQLGFRPINGEGARHAPFQGTDFLMSKKTRCKTTNCSSQHDPTWMEFCEKNCGCSYEFRDDKWFMGSCPL